MNFNQIFYNSHRCPTELCHIGEKYGTDKSPLVYSMGHHSYTPFYNFLFSSIRYRPIVFGEIGIYKNASMKMWREYFPNATLYGWDSKPEHSTEERYRYDFVENAKSENLNNVIYDYMNVRDETSIIESFEKTNTKFDVIIDDSSHDFWDQNKIIINAYKYLNPGGILIIEDITCSIWSFGNQIEMGGFQKYYQNLTHVRTSSSNQQYPYDRDELLVFIKNEVTK